MKIPAAVLRDFAHSHGMPVGKRGRIGHDVVVAFLMAHPRTAREAAVDLGIPVGKRGRLAPATVEAVAAAL